ncbi:hypothetical protein O2N63_03070 [Aliiroseovarius sp. KMU-50]|uniref:Uncharacterized protein n=1 Tax=Aliiroseovarius salicola TaxID=3009082 RepID=A0ABT4VXS8_9RHOB|nr:hypothetical protein [Aliiroseovarius sp. KMU-50]MDA5093059.1 hypothetical protein [Aliiroseovarius sp. KMU-50]
MPRLTLPSLTRTLMMPCLVASLSLNPAFAEPNYPYEREQNSDISALIATLLGLAIVGSVISNSNDNDEQEEQQHYQQELPDEPNLFDEHEMPDEHVYRDEERREHIIERKRERAKYRLPGKCLRKFKTQFGKERYWGTRCLQNRYEYARSLPRACRTKIVAKNKEGVWVLRKVYQPACLREEGYRKRH